MEKIKIITTVKDMHEFSRQAKKAGKRIGFVPTMGYLHEGHMSLIRKAKELSDIVVVSVFVNPTQFGPNEDFAKYPRDFERDKKLIEDNGGTAIFYPTPEEIYGQNFQTYVSLDELPKTLEGEFRPSHFKGVTTVVSILFNCVSPDVAVFGQKDAQQAAIIKRMTKDLKFDCEIIEAPIVREQDGLALSSRNIYLSASERKDALVLSKSLFHADALIKKGEKSAANLIQEMTAIINSVATSKLDYVSIVDAETFVAVKTLEKGKEYYFLIACRIGATRLIDNMKITL
ncbi:MAG TPA: pantoate--beta-alanine ligase [Ignavibacteriales bacterium]|nr:pantoate--beta-alanine ligase [Ignavibacteriales bacterium]